MRIFNKPREMVNEIDPLYAIRYRIYSICEALAFFGFLYGIYFLYCITPR